MPMYDYKCNECGYQFVAIVPLSYRDEKQECPVCKSDDADRIVSLPAGIGFDSYSGGSSCGGGGSFT